MQECVPLDGDVVGAVVEQMALLHVRISVSFNLPFSVFDNQKSSFEVQLSPPDSGCGLSQILVFDCWPPPQGREQLLQLLQPPHEP